MMKLLILTVVVLSVGFSECYDAQHPPRPEGFNSDEALQAFFNIKKDAVDAKCDKVKEDSKTRWEKVGKALEALGKAVMANKAYNSGFQYQKDVINAALPCAKQAEKDQKLEFYKNLPMPDQPKKQ